MTRPLVGLDYLHYATVTTDGDETVYGNLTHVENAVSLTVNPNTDFATFFADDGPREAFSQIGEVDVSIQVADLEPQDYALLIGADYDPHTGLIDYSVDAVAPDVAIGFRAQKTNGEYRYVWLLKGKFGIPDMEHQTKEATVAFQTQTINGKFVARTSDSLVYRRADSDDVAYTPDTWFVLSMINNEH